MTEERIRVGRQEGQPTPGTQSVSRRAAEVAQVQDVEVVREHEVVVGSPLSEDRVRWGPIAAGLLTALTALLVLGLLGLAVGLTTVNSGTAAAQGRPPSGLGTGAAIWSGLSGIIAFLLGGYVAGRTASVFTRGWGALNGALVFMLAVPLTLWLAGQGLGAVLGTLGNLSGALATNPGAAQGAADQAQAAAQNVSPADVARAAEGVRNTAWGILIGALLGLGSSALGGTLGTRQPMLTEQTTRHVGA